MSRDEAELKPDYRRLSELAEEFTRHWNKLHAFFLDAFIGFQTVREYVEADQKRACEFVRGSGLDTEEFQDTRQFSYNQIFSGSFCASSIQRGTQGEVKARNSPDGANLAVLGQLCLTSFYDFWNDYLRREYVIAKGLLDPNERNSEVAQKSMRDHASHDLWGDLYYLRSSIVHKQGIAVDDVKKCKLITWFRPGEPIMLRPEHMRELFLALLKYRNELFAEQFEKHYILLEDAWERTRRPRLLKTLFPRLDSH